MIQGIPAKSIKNLQSAESLLSPANNFALYKKEYARGVSKKKKPLPCLGRWRNENFLTFQVLMHITLQTFSFMSSEKWVRLIASKRWMQQRRRAQAPPLEGTPGWKPWSATSRSSVMIRFFYFLWIAILQSIRVMKPSLPIPWSSLTIASPLRTSRRARTAHGMTGVPPVPFVLTSEDTHHRLENKIQILYPSLVAMVNPVHLMTQRIEVSLCSSCYSMFGITT